MQMSFSGAILILAIIAIRALAMNKLPKKTFLALWGIALLRLLVPFSLPSMYSAYSVIGQNTPAMQAIQNTPATNFFPVAPSEAMTVMQNTAGTVEAGTSIPIWTVIWAIGAFACFLFFSFSYIRCRREFQTTFPVENDFIKDWLAAHKGTHPLILRQSGWVSTPLTYGVFRPVILLPKGTD